MSFGLEEVARGEAWHYYIPVGFLGQSTFTVKTFLL
jgi:hypothetical protein